MFTDEIYEHLLINEKKKLTTVHSEICKKNLTKDSSAVDIKRIENAYQCFRRRHPEYPEDSFRKHCYTRWSIGRTQLEKADRNFRLLGWVVKPEYRTGE